MITGVKLTQALEILSAISIGYKHHLQIVCYVAIRHFEVVSVRPNIQLNSLDKEKNMRGVGLFFGSQTKLS